MSPRFITYVIIGVAFGFTQMWFVYWVVKLFKEKQRILAARRAESSVGAQPGGGRSSLAAQARDAKKPAGGAGPSAVRR